MKSSALVLAAVVACGHDRDDRAAPVKPRLAAAATRDAPIDRPAVHLTHATPYVPPQCYTRTRDDDGHVHNPCFTCHVDAPPPNYAGDASRQLSYDMGPPAQVNPWSNLFVDRRAQVAAIPDDDMLAYVRQDNYRAPGGGTVLDARLDGWDADGDGRWSGWRPDVAFDFDARGFDHDARGDYTGWRAYGYYPLPGAFWPTNGSFGDVLIRLPAAFRERDGGGFDRVVYETNLAILEALIARRDVAIDATDEAALGVDLDGDGALATAHRIAYRWRPGGDEMRWVGRARALQASDTIHLAAGLFPEGTELAHSVRYLDVDGDHVAMAPRMKELRYMVKEAWLSYGKLQGQASREARETDQNPSAVRAINGNPERGIGNRAGWRLQAFIEDAGGALRPQTLEEHAYCIGCHSGLGATDDSVFSFGRKLPAAAPAHGWFHWSQHDLTGIAEPRRADGRGEYAFYLEQNGAGDELRANREVIERFLDGHGALRPDMRARLARDIAALLVPSPARALALDKAYRVIVREQSFVRGRDVTIEPAREVHKTLPAVALDTGVTDPVVGPRQRPAPRAPAPRTR